MIKKVISSTFRGLLGDRRYYQFARFLWHDARRDFMNKMTTNGEMLVFQAAIKSANSAEAPVVLDIGSNVGGYAEGVLDIASQAGLSSSMRLYCFEPNPACVDRIKDRLQNHPSRDCVTLVPKIVTNRSGEAVFYLTGETANTSSLKIDSREQKAQREIRAECVTLDEFLKEEGITDVLFAKVDTEGNDMNVIEGAAELLKQNRIKFLQFEYNHRWITFRFYLKDVFEFLEPLGYQVAKVTGEGLMILEKWHYEMEVFVEGNYLVGKDFSGLGLPLFPDYSGFYGSTRERGKTF